MANENERIAPRPAVSKATIKSTYPLPAYNYNVVVGGVASPIRFARVSGLEIEYETLTYRDGLSFREGERIQKYWVDKYMPLSLEQGTVARDSFLFEWLRELDERSMEISLCDESGTPVVTWRLAKALAVKMSGPTLDAQTNDVAIDRLEVRVAGISVVHH